MNPAEPAGLWRRYTAWSLDVAALALPATWLAHASMRAGWVQTTAATVRLSDVLARYAGAVIEQAEPPARLASRMLADPSLQAAADAVQAGIAHMLLPWLLAYAALAAVWHIGCERSRWQASPGKHALHMVVVDARANGRPSWLQTVVRHAAGTLSWLTLNLGHALAALPPQKRALHDYLARTRVVCLDDDPRLPAWAVAWLLLQAVAGSVLLAWAVARCMAVMQQVVMQQVVMQQAASS